MAHTVLDQLNYFTCIAFPGFCIQQCSIQSARCLLLRSAGQLTAALYKPVTSRHSPIYFIILLPIQAYCVLLSNDLLKTETRQSCSERHILRNNWLLASLSGVPLYIIYGGYFAFSINQM